jgi:hypothetical protein
MAKSVGGKLRHPFFRGIREGPMKRLISRPWTVDDDKRLWELAAQKRSMLSTAVALRRSEKAVASRLSKLRAAKKKAQYPREDSRSSGVNT